MGYDKNKGHKYEDEISAILLERHITVKQICTNCGFEIFSSTQQQCTTCNIDLKLTAGSGVQEDLIFKHNGLDVSTELKNNAEDPDWGQCALIPTKNNGNWIWEMVRAFFHTKNNGNWIWNYSDTSKEKKPKLIKYYEQFKFKDGSVGLLTYLNNKKIIPNKYRVVNKDMTFELRKQDQKNFEDTKHKISTLAFSKFHEKKSDYVQIGGGYGFFHIHSDSANIGTEQFDAEFTLRFRAKTTNTHFPLCPKCDRECKPGNTPECTSCKILIPKKEEIGHQCPSCLKHEKEENSKIVPYKKFNHRDDHLEFVVVIKNPKIKTKSKFNLDPTFDGQEFPPIKS